MIIFLGLADFHHMSFYAFLHVASSKQSLLLEYAVSFTNSLGMVHYVAVSFSIHIFQCTDNIKTTKNKLKIQHGSPVQCIV